LEKRILLLPRELKLHPSQAIAAPAEQQTGGERTAAAGEAPVNAHKTETHLLVELGNSVLGTVLERSHF
jgi:hypothetical protein